MAVIEGQASPKEKLEILKRWMKNHRNFEPVIPEPAKVENDQPKFEPGTLIMNGKPLVAPNWSWQQDDIVKKGAWVNPPPPENYATDMSKDEQILRLTDERFKLIKENELLKDKIACLEAKIRGMTDVKQ